MKGLKALLFPARAGVILKPYERNPRNNTFPRTRGGDPAQSHCLRHYHRFSPHARG